MKLKLIIIGLLLLLVSGHIASANPYTLDGSKVYIDDDKAYISAVPHTLTKSGYVYFEIISKQYSGNVDLAFGFSSDKMKPTHAEYLNDAGNWVSISSLFTKESYLYDGLNAWHVSSNLPIIEDKSYMIRVWVDLMTWDIHNEKYGFAIKPSFQTLSQAIAAGNLYYLDPWGNASSIPVVNAPSNNQIYTENNPSIIQLNSSSGTWPGEEIMYFYYGDKVDGTTLLGNSSADNSTSSFNWYIYSSGDYNWKVRAWNGSAWSDYSALQSLTAVIPPISRTTEIINGGFETWTDPSHPTNWTIGGAGTIIAQTTDVKYSGNYSMSVTRNNGYSEVYQSIGNYSGKTIAMGGWVRASTVGQNAGLALYTDGGSALQVTHTNSGIWEYLTTSYSVSKLATTARVDVEVFTVNGEVYFDDVIIVEGLYPTTIYPLNGSTINVSYPPLDDTVNFVWQSTDADQYRLVVARDPNFNLISLDVHTSNAYYPTNLQAGTYYWKVYAYVGTTYSDPSDIWLFTIDSTADVTGSVIHGTIYSSDGYLSNSEVILSNSSEGIIETALTGSNGYFLFEGLNPGIVYTLTVNRDLYLSATANINATANPIVKDFYLLPDHTSEEWRHDVKFILTNISGDRFPNVAVNAYMNSDVTPDLTGITGSDGSVTFYMDKSQQYIITFINATQGISETRTLYPSEDLYYVYVGGGVTFNTTTPGTNLTNTSTVYTNRSWSIQNLTSSELNSTIGLGPLGQGVVASTLIWLIAGVAGAAGGVVVMCILAVLGIVTWPMVIFISLFTFGLYILVRANP